MVQWISFICILSLCILPGYMDFHNIFHLINLCLSGHTANVPVLLLHGSGFG